MSVNEVMEVIKKDAVFYRKSGGGVTFSGGEPLAQPVFLRHILERCHALAISTALETSGHFQWQSAKDIIRGVDLVFLDIKHIDPNIHAELTGVSNDLILENAVRMVQENVPLIIRIPIIPFLNDDPENIRATAEFVDRHLPDVEGIELLPYHMLGKMKYEALGLPYKLEHVPVPSEEKMSFLRQIVAEAGKSAPTPSQVTNALERIRSDNTVK